MGAGWFAQEALCGYELERWRKEVTLGEVTSESAQVLELCGFFDALREHAAVQFASDGEDQVDEVVGGSISNHIHHYQPINLEQIH